MRLSKELIDKINAMADPPPLTGESTFSQLLAAKFAEEAKAANPGLAEQKSWTVTIKDWQPTYDNALLTCHWAKAQRLKQADKEVVKFYCTSAGVIPAKQRRRVELTLVLGYRQHACDPLAPMKSFLDAVVSGGFLIDDNEKWMEVVPTQFIRMPEDSEMYRRRGSIIKLTDIENL